MDRNPTDEAAPDAARDAGTDPQRRHAGLPVLDKEGALALMDDEEFYDYFSGEILAAFDDRLDELRSLIGRGKAAELTIKAHSLKGVLAAMGAGRAAASAGLLEMAARSGELDAAPRLTGELEEEFAKVRVILAANG